MGQTYCQIELHDCGLYYLDGRVKEKFLLKFRMIHVETNNYKQIWN